MGNQDKKTVGAPIERGKITAAANDGFLVDNLDRPGLRSRVISCISEDEYTVGDMVYFFMFADGTGKILCKA